MEQHKVTYYEGTIVPGGTRIIRNGEAGSLTANQTVFVFGSNTEGRHGAGAAKTAKDDFGAVYGNSAGLQGPGTSGASSYAIVTKDLHSDREADRLPSISPDSITRSIISLYEDAAKNPDKVFCVAYTNTLKKSLNRYSGYDMISMFLAAAKVCGGIPANIAFSEEWVRTGLFDKGAGEMMNVWAGERENTWLSNMASRPFTVDGQTFENVEQYYQWNKAVMAGDRLKAAEIIQTRDGFVCNKLGKEVQGLDAAKWDSARESVIEKGMLESFRQNPSAVVRLLATGDAVFTHTQAGAPWDEIFPRILTGVRETLAGEFLHMEQTKSLDSSSRSEKEITGNLFEDVSWKTLDEIGRVNTNHVQARVSAAAKAVAPVSYDDFKVFKAVVDKDFAAAWNAMKRGKQIKTDDGFAGKKGLLVGKNADPRQADYLRMRRSTLNSMRAMLDTGAPVSVVEKTFGFVGRNNSWVSRTLHSGGAPGSDFAWGEIGAHYGVEARHYYFEGMNGGRDRHYNTLVNPELFEKYMDEIRVLNEYFRASDIRNGVSASDAGRHPESWAEGSQKLLARNIEQVRNAQAVYAIGEFRSMEDSIVNGGTGYAVAEGMHVGKPVYFFDQKKEQWYSLRLGMAPSPIAAEDVPSLPLNFAGIGTRDINAAGLLAIENVYRKTFGRPLLHKVAEADALAARIGEGVSVDVSSGTVEVDRKKITRLAVKGGMLQIWSGDERIGASKLGSNGWRLLREITENAPAQKRGKIVTVGHSNMTLEDFVDELVRQGVTTFMDVRTWTKSANMPQFNGDSLKAALQEKGIRYMNAGSIFGGHISGGYGKGEKNYAEALADPRAKNGVQWLADQAAAGRTVAVGCTEGNALACHRFWEISYALSHPDLVYGKDAIKMPPEGIDILHCSYFVNGPHKEWSRLHHEELERGLFDWLGIIRTPENVRNTYAVLGEGVQKKSKEIDWKGVYEAVAAETKINRGGTLVRVRKTAPALSKTSDESAATLYTVGTGKYAFQTTVLDEEGLPVMEAFTNRNRAVRNPLFADGRPVDMAELRAENHADIFFRAGADGLESSKGELVPVSGVREKKRWMTPDDPGLEEMVRTAFFQDVNDAHVMRVVDVRSYKGNPNQPWFGSEGVKELCKEAGIDYVDMSGWFGNVGKNALGQDIDLRTRIDTYRQKMGDIVAGLDSGVPTLILGNRSNPLLDNRAVIAAAVSDPESVFSGKIPDYFGGLPRDVVHITSHGNIDQELVSEGVQYMTRSGNTRAEKMGMWDYVASQIPVENGTKMNTGDAPWCGRHAIYHIARKEFGELDGIAYTKREQMAAKTKRNARRTEKNAEQLHIEGYQNRKDLGSSDQQNWLDALTTRGMRDFINGFKLPVPGSYPEAEKDTRILLERLYGWEVKFVSPAEGLPGTKVVASDRMRQWMESVTVNDARAILSIDYSKWVAGKSDAQVKAAFDQAFSQTDAVSRHSIIMTAMTVPGCGEDLKAAREEWQAAEMGSAERTEDLFRSVYRSLSPTGRMLLLDKGREMNLDYHRVIKGDMTHDVYFAPVYTGLGSFRGTAKDVFFANLPKVDRVVDLRNSTSVKVNGKPRWNDRTALKTSFESMGIEYECRWSTKDRVHPGPEALRIYRPSKDDRTGNEKAVVFDLAAQRKDRSHAEGLNWEDRFKQELAVARSGKRTLYLTDSSPYLAAAGLGQAFVREGITAGYCMPVDYRNKHVAVLDQKMMIDKILDKKVNGDWRDVDFEYHPKEDPMSVTFNFVAKPAPGSSVVLKERRRRKGDVEIFPEEKANYGRPVEFTPRGATKKDGYSFLAAESDATLCISAQRGRDERQIISEARSKGIVFGISDEAAVLLDPVYVRKKVIRFKQDLAKIYPDGVPEGFTLHINGTEMNHIANAMSFSGKGAAASENMMVNGKKISTLDAVPVMPTGISQKVLDEFVSMFLDELQKEQSFSGNVLEVDDSLEEAAARGTTSKKIYRSDSSNVGKVYPPVKVSRLLTGGESGVCTSVRKMGPKFCHVRCMPTEDWQYTNENDFWLTPPSRNCKSMIINETRLGLKSGPIERNTLETGHVEAWNERDEHVVRGDEGFVPGLTARQMLTLHFIGFDNAAIWRINDYVASSSAEGLDGKLSPLQPGESAAMQIMGLLSMTGDLGNVTEEVVREAEEKADTEITACHDAGIKIVTCTSPWYPERLRNAGVWDYKYSEIVPNVIESETASDGHKFRPRIGGGTHKVAKTVYEEAVKYVEQTPPPYLHVDGWAEALNEPTLAVTSETGTREESTKAAITIANSARKKGIQISTVILPASGIIPVGEGALRGDSRRSAIMTRENRDARTTVAVPSAVMDEDVSIATTDSLAGAVIWSPVPMRPFAEDNEYEDYRRFHANGNGATVTAGPCLTDRKGYRLKWHAVDDKGHTVAMLNTMVWSMDAVKRELMAVIDKTLDSATVSSQTFKADREIKTSLDVLSLPKVKAYLEDTENIEPAIKLEDGYLKVKAGKKRMLTLKISAIPEVKDFLKASGMKEIQPKMRLKNQKLIVSVSVKEDVRIDMRENSQFRSHLESIRNAGEFSVVSEAVGFLKGLIPGVRISADAFEDLLVSKHDYAYVRHLSAASADAVLALEAAPKKYGSIVAEDLGAATGDKYVVDYGTVSKKMSAYMEGSEALKKSGAKGLSARDFDKMLDGLVDAKSDRKSLETVAVRRYAEHARKSMDASFSIVSYGADAIFCLPAGYPLVEAAVRREYGNDIPVSYGEPSVVARSLEDKHVRMQLKISGGVITGTRPLRDRICVKNMEVRDGFVEEPRGAGMLSVEEAERQRALFLHFRAKAAAVYDDILRSLDLHETYRFENAFWVDARRPDDKVVVYEGNIVRGEVGIDSKGQFYVKGDSGSILDNRSAAGIGNGGDVAGSKEVFINRKAGKNGWTLESIDVLIDQLTARLEGNSEAWMRKVSETDRDVKEEFNKALETGFFRNERTNADVMAQDLLAAKELLSAAGNRSDEIGSDTDGEARKEAVLYILLEKDGFEKRLADVISRKKDLERERELILISSDYSNGKENEDDESEDIDRQAAENANRENLEARQQVDERILEAEEKEQHLQDQINACEAKLSAVANAAEVFLSDGKNRKMKAVADGVAVKLKCTPGILDSEKGKKLLDRAETVIECYRARSMRVNVRPKSEREKSALGFGTISKNNDNGWKVVDKAFGTCVLMRGPGLTKGGELVSKNEYMLAKDVDKNTFRIVSDKYDSIEVPDRKNNMFVAKSSHPDASRLIQGLPEETVSVLSPDGLPAFENLKVDGSGLVKPIPPITLVSKKTYEGISAVRAMSVVKNKDGIRTVKECYNFVGKGGRPVLDAPAGTEWFDEIGIFSQGLAAVKRDGEWFFIDAFGAPLRLHNNEILVFDAPTKNASVPRFVTNEESGLPEVKVKINGVAGTVTLSDGKAVFVAEKKQEKQEKQEKGLGR